MPPLATTLGTEVNEKSMFSLKFGVNLLPVIKNETDPLPTLICPPVTVTTWLPLKTNFPPVIWEDVNGAALSRMVSSPEKLPKFNATLGVPNEDDKVPKNLTTAADALTDEVKTISPVNKSVRINIIEPSLRSNERSEFLDLTSLD